MERIINKIFTNEAFFYLFRKLIHKDFKKEKEIIKTNLNFARQIVVLDFGCGIGQFSTVFNNDIYYGIDNDRICVEFAKKKFKGEFILNKTNKIPFNSETFDLVLILNTFHHLSDSDISPILTEVKRVLKKHGKLFVLDVISVRSQQNPISRFMLRMDRGKFARDFEEMRAVLEKQFKVEKLEYIFTALYKYKEYFAILSPK